MPGEEIKMIKKKFSFGLKEVSWAWPSLFPDVHRC